MDPEELVPSSVTRRGRGARPNDATASQIASHHDTHARIIIIIAHIMTTTAAPRCGRLRGRGPNLRHSIPFHSIPFHCAMSPVSAAAGPAYGTSAKPGDVNIT